MSSLGRLPFADYADADPNRLPLDEDDCGNGCADLYGHEMGCPVHCHCLDEQ